MTLDQLLDNLKNGVLLTDDEEVNLTVGQLRQLVKEGIGEQPNLAELSRQFGVEPAATTREVFLDGIPMALFQLGQDVLDSRDSRQRPSNNPDIWIEPAAETVHLRIPMNTELSPREKLLLLLRIEVFSKGTLDCAVSSFLREWEEDQEWRNRKKA